LGRRQILSRIDFDESTVDAMKIGILCKNPALYSHARLAEAARLRGHDVAFINPQQCYLDITTVQPELYYRGGARLEGFDAIIPRIGASMTSYGTVLLRQFEMMGVYTLNGSLAITRSRDKLRAIQMFSRARLPMPVTAFARAPDDTAALIKLVGGAPLVIKFVEGTHGLGVLLAETESSAENTISAMRALGGNILLQEFIAEAKGSDMRCFVIGDRVVATMRRQARSGDFRANLHRGGTATLIRPTPEERAIAVRAARTLGLNVTGVDILRSARGPLLLEANSSPGLQGIEAATGKDLAAMIIRFIETQARLRRKRSEG
jgi:ribosomal protein S6--L-glutamate ligase